MSSAIAGLEPHPLWDHFARIARIPRPSKKEARIAAHIVGLARDARLEVETDPTGNIVVRKPGAPGKEDCSWVALQSHLDMVCEKNGDVQHDFETEGIHLVRGNGFLKARGTTLGSDNGIGVAAALSIMLDGSIVHGPLEFLFTVDEETGLTGANGLQPGFLRSRILLNLDSEEEGSLYVGCAGGRDTLLTFDIGREVVPAGHVPALVSVKGLRGGHSGVDIHTGRANAVKLLGRMLWEVASGLGIRIARLEGGSKRNAIPREAEALVYCSPSDVGILTDRIAGLHSVIANEYATVEPNFRLEISKPSGDRVDVFTAADQARILRLLYIVPHGVLAMSVDLPGLVETSTNAATIQTEPSRVIVGTSQRSSVSSALDTIVNVVRELGVLTGAKVETTDGYPGWKPNLQSTALRVSQETYRGLFGKEPAVKAIHAGLECGIIGEKYPGMDMVSFGPTIEGAHSPDERVEVSSVKKFWDLLLGTLRNLS